MMLPMIALAPTSRRVTMAGLIGLLAAACAPSKPANMADVCQLRECICGKDDFFWQLQPIEPVLWNDNGQAYCKEGYALQVQPDSK